MRYCKSLSKTTESYRFLTVVKRRRFPVEQSSGSQQPAHKIFFVPNLEIVNQLPTDLHYYLKNTSVSGYVKPSKSNSVHSVDVSEVFCIRFFLENFKKCNDICMASGSRHFPNQIELRDNQDRLLILYLKTLYLPGGGLKLLVSSPFWLVNKTGLPLVFRQDGTNLEAAGQFEEHEQARCMAPLLFSFADQEAGALCNMRVGRSLHSDGVPQWSLRFHLEKGVRVRRLQVSRKDGRPDWVYNIGVDIRLRDDTYVATFSPRYQLVNRTQHRLDFCQLFVTTSSSPEHFTLSSPPASTIAFHWPRVDLDNLLCVRRSSETHWSGGFPIDAVASFHVNMRDVTDAKSNFLRVEVVLQGATFFVLVSEAERLPPPFRIDNQSEVSLTYYQTNVDHERLKSSIRAHSSLPYAFDEPTLPPYVTLVAPGGSAATYNMNVFGEGSQLFYENFIYVVFSGTFDEEVGSPLAGKQYVLDVPFGNRVVINRREAGKRSQLWRMTSLGLLQHEGSEPPRDPSRPPTTSSKTLVLDIADLGPQPGEFTPLVLRKPDPRRKHTQTWYFTEDGRLKCGYPNVYAQSKDGYKGLRRGSEVVLGPSQPVVHVTVANGVAIEQAISRKKLRGGSGVLTVKVVPDGPTRVLQIADIKKATRTSEEKEDLLVAKADAKQEDDLELQLEFSTGVGVSLVNHFNEELVYIWLHHIMIEYNRTPLYRSLGGSVKDIQIDNQLREAEQPVLLHITRQLDSEPALPALHFTVQKLRRPSSDCQIFKHLIVTLQNLTVHLEERLLLKLLQFGHSLMSSRRKDGSREEENTNNNNEVLVESHTQTRYYLSTLKLCLQQVKLSVTTSSPLPADLQWFKKRHELKLVRFEDATIELDYFLRVHPFETPRFLLESILEHYKGELKDEAIKILGAVDFLGNPLGLVNDVTDGISKLIEGNVGGLIKNVAHGISDTAAKITATLSDGLGVVAMDEGHQLRRRQIRGGSDSHMVAGLKGLGFGIVGGVTSVFTQTYEGAARQGVQGFFTGLGKGLVGTVTKPTVGLLDLVSGGASAVRETSKGHSDPVPPRVRPPRNFVGSACLLPRYSFQQALGQEFLFTLNNRDYSELFVSKEQLRSGPEDLRALLSSERVYFVSLSSVVLCLDLADLLHCAPLTTPPSKHYLQLSTKGGEAKPQVRCDSQQVAAQVALQINYAKSLHEERVYMVISDEEEDSEEN